MSKDINILSKVDKDAIDDARLDLDSKQYKPKADPGMEDDDEIDFSDIGSDSGGDWGDFGGGFDNGFNTGFNPAPTPPVDDMETKFFKFVGEASKGTYKFLKELVTDIVKTDSKEQQLKQKIDFGCNIVKLSGLVLVFGFLLVLVGEHLGFQMIIGSLLAAIVGVPTFSFAFGAYTQLKNLEGYVDSSVNDSALDDELYIEEEEEYVAEEFNQPFEEFEEEGLEDLDDYDFSNLVDNTVFTTNTTPSVDTTNVLDNFDTNKGMITRAYLHETLSKVLVNNKQDYDRVRDVSNTSDEFYAWAKIILDSAKILQTGKSDDYPILQKVEERGMYYYLKIQRVSWLKNLDAFLDEIVKTVSYNEQTCTRDNDMYGMIEAISDCYHVKIIKGDTAMVTIKDTYRYTKDFVLDTKNEMPIILGIDVEGKAITKDFKAINSILVTGMPRSGKSWFVQSVLTQMMFYMKPSELNFYICDPKDDISDFKAMTMPHIRKFVSRDEEILETLRQIVRKEGPRRKKIIGDAGCVNITDFKRKHPDVELPLLYVIIDEVVTLAERMDKQVKAEFQGYLFELVSQLPALGIRIFMIPHVVKDQILKKAMTDIIPCRISVRGDDAHIEASVGTKNFEYKLKNQGDMAVRLDNDKTMFVHSAILTPTNEGNNELFEFLTKFWLKIEPESYVGSVIESRDKKKEVKDNKKSENYKKKDEDYEGEDYEENEDEDEYI